MEVMTPSIISLVLSTTEMCLVSEMLYALWVASLLIACRQTQLKIISSYPIFAFTPIHSGGLGVSEAVIGSHMAIRSTIAIPMMFLFPIIQRRTGTIGLYRASMITMALVPMLFPCLNLLVYNNVDEWIVNAVLLGYFVIWAWCGLAWSQYHITPQSFIELH